jgi:hypothetical protein
MTVVTFVPSSTGAPQFQATFDGALYTVICTWNLFGRYYINVYSQDGTLVVCRAMTGSSDDSPQNLLFGYFTSTMYFNEADSQFVIGP